MDLKRPASDEVEPSTSAPVKKKKMDSSHDAGKIEKLMRLYRVLGHEIKKLDDRGIDLFGESYDEESEDKALRRHQALAKKRLRIHKYFARKGLLLDQEEQALKEDIEGEDERIIITSTGLERLNELLTDFVNTSDMKKEFRGVLGEHRHVTSDDITELFAQLEEEERKMLPDDPLEGERFVSNIVLAVNREIKNYMERKHKKSLRELWDADEVLNGSTTAVEGIRNSDLQSTWEDANLKLKKAYAEGDLTVTDEQGLEEFETNMPETAEELDEEEDEEDQESLTAGSSDAVDGISDEEGDEETVELEAEDKAEESRGAQELGNEVEGQANGAGGTEGSEVRQENAQAVEHVNGENDVQEIENADDVENGSEEVGEVDGLNPLDGDDVEVIASDDDEAEDGADRAELAGSSPPVVLVSEDSSSSSIIFLDE